eukprot:12077812-Alexandrium_andersonii.AAC.1
MSACLKPCPTRSGAHSHENSGRLQSTQRAAPQRIAALHELHLMRGQDLPSSQGFVGNCTTDPHLAGQATAKGDPRKASS